MVKKPVLSLPDFNDNFYLQVDVSEHGLSAVLCLRRADDEFGQSNTFVLTYLFGRSFLIKTEHNALVWLNQVKDKNVNCL